MRKHKPINYHKVRVRSGDDNPIFLDQDDCDTFVSILGNNILVEHSVEALAYCIIPEGSCLLLNQIFNKGIDKLVKSIVDEYNSHYFNKYNTEISLGLNNCEIVKVSPSKLLEESCLTHLGLEDWAECRNSSINAYFYDDVPEWLTKSHIAEKYESAVDYYDLITRHYIGIN